MKIFIQLILWLAASGALAQPAPISLPVNGNNQVEFQQVTQLEKPLSVGVIVAKARTWAASAYSSSTDVVQQYDTLQGVLVLRGKGQVSAPVAVFYSGKVITTTVPYDLYYTLTLEARPGRYRTTLTSLELSPAIEQGKNRVPVPAQARSVAQAYDALKATPGSELSKTKNATLNVDNETNRLLAVRNQVEALLKNLESAMRQATKPAGKDW